MSNQHSLSNVDALVKKLSYSRMAKGEESLIEQYGERYHIYRKQFKDAGNFEYEPDFPLYLMPEQTYRCNLRCVSCIHGYPDVRKRYDPGVAAMPRALYERIVLEGEEHNCPSISTHNNDEPLLVKDLAYRIAFARKHGFMDVIMTTNGNLFTEDKIREVIDAGVTRVLFSLDALTEETYSKVRPGGTLKKVLWAMERTMAYRDSIRGDLPIIRVSFVVNALNQHELKPFIETYSRIVDYIDVQPMCAMMPYHTKLIADCSERVTDFRCNGPWRSLIIRPNGDILPCPNFCGAESVMGNLYKKSLYEVFNSVAVKKFRQECKNGTYSCPGCIACSQHIYCVNMDKL